MVFLTLFFIYLVFQSFYGMNRKRKLTLFISTISICLTIFAGKFILDGSYRSQLPEYPDFKTIPKSLQEQISAAGRKTHRNPSSANLGNLGMVYHSSGYYDKASVCYKLAVKKNSDEWIWSYYLGYLNLELGESNASIEYFKSVFEKNPKNYLALYYTGEAFQNIGSINNAEEIFKKIAALGNDNFIKENTVRNNCFPLQTYALFRLSRIYKDSNRLDSAEMTLRKLIENQITFGPAYRLLGNVYTMKGNLALGNKYTIRANDLRDYTPPTDILVDKLALISRSDEYLLKQIDDAISSDNFNWALMLCDHALKYLPDNKLLISKTIMEYLYMGFDNKALPYLDKHIKYFSDDFHELMNLADLLHGKGFESQAMNYFNEAKKLQPGDSRLSLWLTNKGMINEAIIILDEQLKEDPENVKVLSDEIHLLLNSGQKEKAMSYLKNLKRLSPSSPEVKKLEGRLLEMEGNMKKALSDYEEAYKINPKDLFIIKYLSTIYIRDKMWDQAIHHFRSALENVPNEPILLEGLGRLLILCPDSKLRNLKEGIEYSERAYINYKSSFATKLSAGRDIATAYAILGDKKKASEYIKITTDLAIKGNVSQDYIPYLETLRKRYNISN